MVICVGHGVLLLPLRRRHSLLLGANCQLQVPVVHFVMHQPLGTQASASHSLVIIAQQHTKDFCIDERMRLFVVNLSTLTFSMHEIEV